jgi:hypothetical protein
MPYFITNSQQVSSIIFSSYVFLITEVLILSEVLKWNTEEIHSIVVKPLKISCNSFTSHLSSIHTKSVALIFELPTTGKRI